MTDMRSTVTEIRRILQDRPEEDYLQAAIDDTEVLISPNDITLWAKGNIWEFDDGDDDGAEIVRVRETDTEDQTAELKRGHEGSSAVSHDSGAILIKDPRFRYNEVAQAVKTALAVDLYNQGIYDIQEHVIESSDTSYAYAAPTSSCVEWLFVYQKLTADDSPLPILDYTRKPRNVDTSLWSTGKVFEIGYNLGVPGSDDYYVNCAHKLTLATLSESQERIVHFLAAAYLLDWTEPRRLAGPLNQGDETVTPGAGARIAAYYREQAKLMIHKERAYLKALNPSGRTFVKDD